MEHAFIFRFISSIGLLHKGLEKIELLAMDTGIGILRREVE